MELFRRSLREWKAVVVFCKFGLYKYQEVSSHCYAWATRKRFFNQKEFGWDLGYLSRSFCNLIIDDGWKCTWISFYLIVFNLSFGKVEIKSYQKGEDAFLSTCKASKLKWNECLCFVYSYNLQTWSFIRKEHTLINGTKTMLILQKNYFRGGRN